MLETILQSINKNLERLANAQETANELSKKLIEPVDISLDKSEIKQVETMIPATIVEPKTEQVMPTTIVQETVDTPAIPTTVAQKSVATPIIPTTPVQESFTREQLAVAMSNAVSAGKMNVVQGILQQFGVQALTQINPADYNKVAIMLKEAGVNV